MLSKCLNILSRAEIDVFEGVICRISERVIGLVSKVEKIDLNFMVANINAIASISEEIITDNCVARHAITF